MKKLTSLIITAILILSCFCSVQAANFKLPDLISDNMLIQRDMPVKLWGYGGTPGEAITIEIEDKKGIAINEGNTTIDDKSFSITLPSMEAGGPYTIRFSNSKGDKLASVYNVLVGDLWFQGGQSNMQATIPRGQTNVPERVIPNPKDDTIKLFYNGSHISSDTPANDLKGEWIIADKKTVDYSAVGYKALETIHNALDIPVGGICSPYGGLKTSDGKSPWGFRIAGEDGIYYEAKASLAGNTITLTSDKVPSPVNASYGIEKHIWHYNDLKGEDDIASAPELPEFLVNVVNSEGLPLGAFSTSQSVSLLSEINTEKTQNETVTSDKESLASSNNAGKYTEMA